MNQISRNLNIGWTESAKSPQDPKDKKDVKRDLVIPEFNVRNWRDWFEKIEWNIKIDLNPRSLLLDKNSAISLAEQTLNKFQIHLFGAGAAKLNLQGRIKNTNYPKGLFVLVPELNPAENIWHYHGFGLIKSKKRTHDLLENGSRWFANETMKHFYAGKSFIPKNRLDTAGNIYPYMIPRPTSKISLVDMKLSQNGFRGYALKNWNINQKEELVCVSGRNEKSLLQG